MKRFYPEIEALRGLAALMVAGEHCFISFVPNQSVGRLESFRDIVDAIVLAFFPGATAVPVFFVISGFVLAVGAPSAIGETVRGWPGFVVRRLVRIVPAMWLSVALGATLVASYSHVPGLREIARNLLFQSSSLNGPLWSLKVELYLSPLVPLFVLVVARARMIGNLLIVLGLLWCIERQQLSGILNYMACFFLGVLAARSEALFARVPRRVLRWAFVAALAAIFGILPFTRYVLGGGSAVFLTVASLASFVIVAHCAFAPTVTPLLRARPVRFLGRVSYSFYVLHALVKDAIAVALTLWIGWDALVAHPIAAQIALFLLSVPIGLAAAALSYRYVERPFIMLARSRDGGTSHAPMAGETSPAARPQTP